jgi:hypothetical protein
LNARRCKNFEAVKGEREIRPARFDDAQAAAPAVDLFEQSVEAPDLRGRGEFRLQCSEEAACGRYVRESKKKKR